MAANVYDLAVEVILYLVAFQRRVDEGDTPSYEDTRAEVLALLNDLDQRSHAEAGLFDHWAKARVPLVYLIDEVMILNCTWEHRNTWANDCLEVALLGHPEALGGEKYYKECDEALRELEVAERHERHDHQARVETVMVFYVGLQTGFQGQIRARLGRLARIQGPQFSPSCRPTPRPVPSSSTPETEQHTVLLNPNYEPITRLLYVFLAFLFIVALYFGATWGYWSELTGELAQHTNPETGVSHVPTAGADFEPPIQLSTSDDKEKEKDEDKDENENEAED